MSINFTNDGYDPEDEKLKQYLVSVLQKSKIHDERIHDSYKHLTPIQRERVNIAFKEGVIRGYKIDTVGIYITLQTKLRVSQKFVMRIRINHFREHKDWFMRFAKDSYAFIGVFRKAVDEIEALKDENWKIIQSKSADIKVKAEALKELHNLAKSTVLIMKDLPFVTNLAKYYDPKSLEEYYGIQQKAVMGDRDGYSRKYGQYYDTMVKNQLDKTNLDIAHRILDEKNNNRRAVSKDDVIDSQDADEEIMEDLQNQVDKYSIDAVQQNQDQKMTQGFLENQVRKIEEEMDDIVKNSEAKEKIEDLKQRHMNVLSYIDEITTKDQKDSIERIKGLEEDDNS